MPPQADLLPGTLDLLILKGLSLGQEHGYGVLLRIEQMTGGALVIEQGALYPALYRLEHQGLLATEWGTSDNNRKAKFYTLTPAGRKRLKAETERWNTASLALNRALRAGGLAMTILARLRSFGRNLFRRADLERGMSEEMQFHLERRAAALAERRGLSSAEALRLARLEFGSTERYKEESRQSLGLRLLDECAADLRFARRTLGKNRGFFAAAVATLALGIGTNTAVFSVIDALVLRPLPVHAPHELVAFNSLIRSGAMLAAYSGNGRRGPDGTSRRSSFSALTFERLREDSATLSSVFAYAPLGSQNVASAGFADVASAQVVSGDYHRGLGVGSVVGRTLGPSDDRPDANPSAVISYRYWQRRFAGDRSVVGRSITVNRSPFTIVGVTAADFYGTEPTESVDITVPLALASQVISDNRPRPVSTWWLRMMARRRPGVTIDQVYGEVRPLFEATVRESWAARPPQTGNPSRTGMPVLQVLSGAHGPHGLDQGVRQALLMFSAVTAAVLLIGCLNLANLLLVRASARREEMTMRRALGASRSRVVRQLLLESLVLAAAGAAAGLILAAWGNDWLPWFMEADAVVDSRIDIRSLSFACGLALVTTLGFGIGPAIRATAADLSLGSRLKTSVQKGGVGRALMTRSLIGLQVAASVSLLVGAGLFARTLYNFSRVDIGFNPRNLLVFSVDPGPAGNDRSGVYELFGRLTDAIESVPGVESVTLSAVPVLADSEWTDLLRTTDGGTPLEGYLQSVKWNFFDTMRIPLLGGRALQADDVQGHHRVAVINVAMARLMFGDAPPVGRHITFVNGSDRDVPIEVVGIVADSKYARLTEAAPPTAFMPHTQMPPGRMVVAVRTALPPLSLADEVRQSIRRVDPSLPMIDPTTQERQIDRTIRSQRVFALLTALAAAVGLLLACIGLYGVVSYDAKTRTNEIGIRMALGAGPGRVVRLIIRQTMVTVLVGAVIGVASSIAASRFIAAQLFGVAPGDPLTVALAAALLVVIATLAAYVPARRAAKLDPTVALRCD